MISVRMVGFSIPDSMLSEAARFRQRTRGVLLRVHSQKKRLGGLKRKQEPCTGAKEERGRGQASRGKGEWKGNAKEEGQKGFLLCLQEGRRRVSWEGNPQHAFEANKWLERYVLLVSAKAF